MISRTQTNLFNQSVKHNKETKEISCLSRWCKKLLKSKTGTVGFVIVLIFLLTAIFAPWLASHDPIEQHHTSILAPPCWVEGGNREFILGTDNLGRDILSRIIYGSRVSVMVGVFSVSVAGILGLLVGLISGYYGGWVDDFIMCIINAFLSIPGIIFALVILKIVGSGLITLVFVLGFTRWVTYARVIRSEVLSLKERDFVRAAKSIGVTDWKIMWKHLAPNVFPTFIVIATLNVAVTILAEASLSFLGLGIQPPTISWGGMLSIGRNYLSDSWGLATFPGIAITITTLGIIFLGDWLRDVLDPRSKQQ